MKNLKHLIALAVALVFVGTASVFAQEGFRIVTNHPDFKIKVVRCEVSGKTCVIDMILENTGYSDVDISIGNSEYGTVAYDDEANEHKRISVSIGSNDLSWYSRSILPAQIPIKARLQIEGVPESATMFRRMDITFNCDAWKLNGDKKVKFYNLPITHDGD